MRSNCLLWALALRKRRKAKGRRGYIWWRASWTVLGHFLYAERRPSGSWRVVSYVPRDPRHKLIPPPWFKGDSKWGDL